MNASELKGFFEALSRRFEEEKVRLGELDAILGDGDHGSSMARGFAKAYEAIKDKQEVDIGNLFHHAGKALLSGIGGASGPLFAMVLLELGKAHLGEPVLSVARFKQGVEGAAAAVQKLGKAQANDKTMLDVLLPVSEALPLDMSLTEALELAAKVAQDSADKTATMPAKKGRAQYVQGAGLGHPDPGARSVALFFQTLNQSSKGKA